MTDKADGEMTGGLTDKMTGDMAGDMAGDVSDIKNRGWIVCFHL